MDNQAHGLSASFEMMRILKIWKRRKLEYFEMLEIMEFKKIWKFEIF
jgi:hypothetical protein